MDVDEPSLPLLQDDEEKNIDILEYKRLENAAMRSPMQEAISQTFKSTAHLAKLLPTGTVMAFQLLSPIFTNQGYCDSMTRTLATILVLLCGLLEFLLSFTDSFPDMDGNACHGFATFKGLWVVDGSTKLPLQLADQYCLGFLDFLHEFMSVFVFAAVVLFDPTIVRCFYPNPRMEIQEMLTAIPIGIGVVCSMLFVAFPTKRHGIGFSLS